MLLNKKYIKNGPIDLSQLFILEDITQKVIDNQEQVALKNMELLQMLSDEIEPQKEIGKHF
jgi:hypothetical protein